MKTCKSCGVEKPLTEFYNNRTGKNGKHAHCKVCNNLKYPRDRREMYWQDVKRRNGITQQDYQALLDGQGGVCAICKQPENYTRNGEVCRLCVDHDHDTAQIRGLLCRACNKALGLMKDNPVRLLSAAEYLKNSKINR